MVIPNTIIIDDPELYGFPLRVIVQIVVFVIVLVAWIILYILSRRKKRHTSKRKNIPPKEKTKES